MDLYLAGNTPLHRLDPRVKVFGLLAMALESRGFGSSGRRTDYLELRARWWDYLVVGALLMGVAAAIWWRLSGHGAVLPRI